MDTHTHTQYDVLVNLREEGRREGGSRPTWMKVRFCQLAPRYEIDMFCASSLVVTLIGRSATLAAFYNIV